MKLNKKILIPVFATAMGLSVIGGISGAVAWYQYNSKVTSSFIGVSVADTGVLQIKDGASSDWTRAVKQGGADSKIRPVTFGKTDEGIGTKDAWMYPEAGAGNGYYEGVHEAGQPDKAGWVKAGKNTDYFQFDLYFNAFQTDSTEDTGYKYVERDVALSKFYIRCLKTGAAEDAGDSGVDGDKVAEKAMRVQFDFPEEADESIILSSEGGETVLSGALDLDGNEHADSYHKTPFNVLPDGATDGTQITYGVSGETQEHGKISDYVVAEDTKEGSAAKKLFSTKGDEDGIHVVVTIWLEGWDLLDNANNRAEWNAKETADCQIQVALEFTSGIFRGSDLTPAA